METFGWWVFVSLIAIVMLFVIFLGAAQIWGLILKHIFRQYEKFKQWDIPKGTLRLSTVLVRSDEIQIRLNTHNGYCVIYLKPDDNFGALLQKVTERLVEQRRVAEAKGGVVTVGNINIWIPFPPQPAAQSN